MADFYDVVKKPVNKIILTLYDEETGDIKETQTVMNQVQTLHATYLATQVDSTPAQASGLYQFMDVGTGAMGNAAATDLTTPLLGPGSRQAITASTSAGAVVTTTATFAAGVGTGVLTEIGVFTTIAGADMMCTAAIAITKAAGDALAISWANTFS